MMLSRVPQMLKTPSRVNKGNAMNNDECSKARDAVDGNEGAYTHFGQLKEYPKLPTPPLPQKISFHSSS